MADEHRRMADHFKAHAELPHIQRDWRFAHGRGHRHGSWTTAPPIAAKKSVDRLRSQWSNLLLVHTPVHASWLNQIEIYFSIVQRKVLTPNDFQSLNELEQRLLAFQRRYEETASPFQWTFTRRDLAALLAKIEKKRLAPAA
jgi:hypothetical protein